MMRGSEQRALHGLAVEAAAAQGVSLAEWLEGHGISRKAVYGQARSNHPSLGTIYRVCDAAGVKVSEFFERLGR